MNSIQINLVQFCLLLVVIGFCQTIFADRADINQLPRLKNMGQQINVFTIWENPTYVCVKIPYLTSMSNGNLIAFGEARVGSCSDYTETHLVYKISSDNGKTWKNPDNDTDSIKILYMVKGQVVGNAGPVMLQNGRLVVLFNVNNLDNYEIHSDDFGVTWSEAKLLSGVSEPDWKWVGIGPPAGIQLESGRILIPAYHTKYLKENGLISWGHTIISDDMGSTWRMNKANHYYSILKWPNEAQAVDLGNNTVLINSRNAAGIKRIQTYSYDGGETFGPIETVSEMNQPITGCEGSTFYSKKTDSIYVTAILPLKGDYLYRQNLVLYRSTDKGKTWELLFMIKEGPTAYSALAINNGSLVVLYESSDKKELVFIPNRIIFQDLGIDA